MYRRDISVKELFEQAVEYSADHVAVSQGNIQLTYAELNQEANRLARVLLARGLHPGEFVGLIAERSPEMIVALLAIVKAGGAYIPLDLSYPETDLGAMCDDAQLRWIIAQPSLQCSIAVSLQKKVEILAADLALRNTKDSCMENPQNSPAPTDPIYAMFTSGSTGKPKGVVVPHRAVIRLVFDTSYLHFGEEEIFLQLSPIGFDASTLEIWGSLLHGSHLALMPPETPTLESIAKTIQSASITTMFLTTALFHLAADKRSDMFADVRQLVFGGDVADPKRIVRLAQRYPDLRLINGYGPTENTTFTTCYVVPPDYQLSERLPIGWPLTGTEVYIVDENMHPVADGQRGHLVTAGDGVALGYLNRPEATAERFVPNMLSQTPGSLYLTGDQARRLPDGSYEFFGRLDSQVKVSGHRVELDAIEGVLRSHPSIREVAVIAAHSDETEKRLAAFVELQPGNTSTATELRSYLQTQLPSYSVPSKIELLAAMPMTTSGKIDRKRLSDMATRLPSRSTAVPQSRNAGSKNYSATVRQIWQSTLRQSVIGLDDNFFDLGGTSLDLIAIHAELARTVHSRLRITDLFANPTPRTLAKFLDRSMEANRPVVSADPSANASTSSITGGRA